MVVVTSKFFSLLILIFSLMATISVKCETLCHDQNVRYNGDPLTVTKSKYEI